jgi:hypothetical protein
VEEDGEETVLYYERDEGDELEGHAGEAHRDEAGDWSSRGQASTTSCVVVGLTWRGPGAAAAREVERRARGVGGEKGESRTWGVGEREGVRTVGVERDGGWVKSQVESA